ncbi:MAG: phosphoribosylaminoimidazolesuccinocarboxamide synthase [Sandaracinaceae bacterium]
MTVDEATLRRGLGLTLDRTALDHLGPRVEGKVRDAYRLGGGRRVLVTTDRISAFDRVLGTLPFKGQVLNQLSAWWFEATADVAPNHRLAVPDPAATLALECEPLPVEWVMRAYLTGVTSTSIWTHYQAGERVFCGHRLPDGLRKNEPLPEPLLTPSTKAGAGGHDRSVSRAEVLASGALDEGTFDEAARMAAALFARGQAVCQARGLILVDTKYEIGRAPDGQLRVIDEIHTPDSSRLWFDRSYEASLAEGAEPESFDKEHVRRWLASVGFTGEGAPPPLPDDLRVEAARRYLEACEAIRGEPFVPDLEDPTSRLSRTLGALR